MKKHRTKTTLDSHKFDTSKYIKLSSYVAKSKDSNLKPLRSKVQEFERKAKQFPMGKNISIIWDFDQTLTPDDSTNKTVEILNSPRLNSPRKSSMFWTNIKELRGGLLGMANSFHSIG